MFSQEEIAFVGEFFRRFNEYLQTLSFAVKYKCSFHTMKKAEPQREFEEGFEFGAFVFYIVLPYLKSFHKEQLKEISYFLLEIIARNINRID